MPIYDSIVDELSQRGINLLAIFNDRSRIGTAYENTEEWLEYIKATVAHFKGKIKYWEIINEHDIHEPYKSEGGAELYGNLLKRAYKAVKEANPEAVVLYGGIGVLRQQGIYFKEP